MMVTWQSHTCTNSSTSYCPGTPAITESAAGPAPAEHSTTCGNRSTSGETGQRCSCADNPGTTHARCGRPCLSDPRQEGSCDQAPAVGREPSHARRAGKACRRHVAERVSCADHDPRCIRVPDECRERLHTRPCERHSAHPARRPGRGSFGAPHRSGGSRSTFCVRAAPRTGQFPPLTATVGK